MNPGIVIPKVRIKERFFLLLKSDTIKLIIIILVTFWLYNYFSYYFTLKFTLNRTFNSTSWFLVHTVPYLFFFLIFGLILGILIEKKILVKSFLAGIILSLLIITKFPFITVTWSVGIDVHDIHYLFPILAFPLGILVVKALRFDKRSQKLQKSMRWAFTIIISILFIWLGSRGAIGYFKFYSSSAYKNSLHFEVPILPEALDVEIKKSSRRGSRNISYRKQANYLSMEVIDYYDEFFKESGFSHGPLGEGPGWSRHDALGPNLYFIENYLNKKLEILEIIIIEQIPLDSKNLYIQKVIIQISPYPKEYEKMTDELIEKGNQTIREKRG